MRRLLTAVAAALLLAVSAAPSASGAVLDDSTSTATPERLVLDLSSYEDATTTISPLALTPEQASGIGPGSHLIIAGVPGDDGGRRGCTANYVWQDPDGQKYLGAAGHCFLPDDATATHGSDADAELSGVTVDVCVSKCSFGGFTGFILDGKTVELGQVAYARQTRGDDALGNDFGLVEIPAALADRVRTSMPVFGGPTEPSGLIGPGDHVCHHGAGVVVGETWPTMGRTGAGVTTVEDEGWWLAELTASPGDSGSAVQLCERTGSDLTGTAAAGLLTHLTSLGVAGTTMASAIKMASDDASLSISPVLGAS